MHTQSPGTPEWNERLLADVVSRLASKEGRPDEAREQAIERWVRDAAAQFVGAPVQIFVPVLVEHIVRQKITVSPALATTGAGAR